MEDIPLLEEKTAEDEESKMLVNQQWQGQKQRKKRKSSYKYILFY
jgi:hypothetical protein